MLKQQPMDVAIIGAGPYGLSIAAHLRAYEVSFRIFGTPMSSWRNHMAAGTMLKSFGCASSLYDPGSTFTLQSFCRERGLHYDDVTTPVSLETFTAYGMEFQSRFVPHVEETDIVSLERAPEGFALTTAAGERVLARRVVLAVGITHFAHLPPTFAEIPRELVTHSSQHVNVDRFAGMRVAVVGAGASAADLAGLLQEAGAETHMIARRDKIDFHDPPEAEPRPMLKRMLKPRSGIGHGWRGRLCTEYPVAFHALPEKFRLLAVDRVNGPAPGWFAKSKVVGHVTLHLGTSIKSIAAVRDGVQLQIIERGGEDALHVDHVIAATGYKVSLRRLGFLNEELRNEIVSVNDAPVLNTSFESSVAGLYMVGLASANSFGPLCRFAYGAKFTAPRIARHLAAVQ